MERPQIFRWDITRRRLPAGTFESNMTFVQSLTEAVKRAPRAVMVASLPESDVEIGGAAGQAVHHRGEGFDGDLPWHTATGGKHPHTCRRHPEQVLFNGLFVR
jgi:hypothetical protein